MEDGLLLLATVVIPLATALVIMAIPSRQADAVRTVAVISGFVLFVLSVYLFFSYQAGDEEFQYTLRWDWISNAAFLGENGITLYRAWTASPRPWSC
jgi:NADH:ubiquinone oxidoreductase subunit 4 (subunit M)